MTFGQKVIYKAADIALDEKQRLQISIPCKICDVATRNMAVIPNVETCCRSRRAAAGDVGCVGWLVVVLRIYVPGTNA